MCDNIIIVFCRTIKKIPNNDYVAMVQQCQLQFMATRISTNLLLSNKCAFVRPYILLSI